MTEPMPVAVPAEEPTKPADSYWNRAAYMYTKMGPPLRPSAQDICFFEETVAAYAAQHSRASRAVLLGATTDIAAMRWPSSFSLIGIDHSSGMLRAVWPGNVPGKRWAVNGDWLSLPKRPSSCDVIIGDGSMNCVRSDEHRAFARSISAALKPEGILILRCFAEPETQEHPDEVFEDALRGEIPTFSQFRFRLLLAMQPSLREGVAVKNVYRFWERRYAAEPELFARAGWTQGDLDVIERYRDGDAVFSFPTLAECRAALSEFFEEIAVSFGTYYAGGRCPRLVLTPRRSGG